ncbi:hypothetical protein [Crocosphaera chwakensis]|uniref:Uncharacterized protein n=1 Tax=Crocosphaera chwakensis CCY0110 TaxID=391612 RepID=A3IXA9_9CHRO|nr:hypothetical protein [Crocosphaera chwakensis]EAZ88902.1 hypothetical protein CY0110_31920 [Crocosphaera chwakensis CCY0110]
MSEQLLNYDHTVALGEALYSPLSPNYRWTTFEVFCDGFLVYQQTIQGIHINAQVSPDYKPLEIVIAFDGEPVFALRGSQVCLNRLNRPLISYTPD